MRTLVQVSVLSSLLLFVGCGAQMETSQTVRDVPQYTIEEFLETIAYRGVSFSPDESTILVSSDESGVFNAYSVPVAGGTPTQLTHSTTDAVITRSYFPNDERFIYESDQGGNELNHVYVRELDGSITDLAPGEGHKAAFTGWAHDNKSLFLTTNERDQRYFDLYEIDLDAYERTLVYENNDGYIIDEISRDKRFIALRKSHTRVDTDLYVYDTQTQKLQHLTPHEGDVFHEASDFSPDGGSLYLVTDEGNEFRYLVRHDLETNSREVILKTGWDVLGSAFSETGKYLVTWINDDARTKIQVYESKTMQAISLPDFPDGDIRSLTIADSEKHFAFYLNGSRAPSNLYVYELGGKEAEKLTHSMNPKVDANDLVEAEVVRFASYDGLAIPGLLYRPHTANADNKVPTLIWVHGGPGGQSRVGYNALIQYLVNNGYAVFAINNRGSSGYGKTFFLADDRKHGSADLDDCVASKQFLVEQGYVDSNRIGIIGGSYGGFMVLAGLAFRPEEFVVGVNIFGVSNWIRTLESIPPWWEANRKALYKELGDPEIDREYLHSISPLFHASNIKRPLMVLQGANDPRVHKAESDDIVEAARKNGVDVEYLVFDDEGHGFRKKANRLRGYKAIRDFCDQHLKNVSSGGVATR